MKYSRFLSVFLAALFLLVFAKAEAQTDPQAKKDLQELRDRYTNAGAIDAQVTLEIKLPEVPAEVQKGRILQKGDQFRLTFPAQEVISDGKTTWLYLPANKEVQVYDATETNDVSGGFTKPQDILNLYDSKAYEYAITGTVTEGGKQLRQIEFKPVDKNSELAKMRLTYDPVKDEVHNIRVFNKDGSRYALILSQVKLGATIAASSFVFDQKAYPGVRVEDMRL